MIQKSLKEISLPITEEEYRKDGRMHYSTLAKFERTGFNGLETLFDRVESPSLTFGSVVDEMITGTMESFNEKFLVAEFPQISDTLIQIVKKVFEREQDTSNSLYEVPDSTIIEIAAEFNYQNNWKPETRAKVIKEKCADYYNLLYISSTKTIISSKDYQDACNAVQALRGSEATKWYFEEDNPFDGIERLYQLKFAAIFDEMEYSIMADVIVVDHVNKVIYPCDLKTSGKKEWEFHKSFIDWSYSIQARQYYAVLEENIKRDDYFKDFTICDYRFIVVNRESLTPLVWEFPQTKERGTLYFGKNKQIELRDPFDIAKELKEYLEYEHTVPINIETEVPNNLEYWLNKL